MSRITGLFRKFSLLVRRVNFAVRLDEEMAFHRTQAEKEFAAAGMSARVARIAAARQFGNPEKLKESSHEVIGFRFETVMQDLRFALRQLRKNPGFAATATLILALGIGASVAIFGFVDAALIKPLPYVDSSRLTILFREHSAGAALSSLLSRLSGLEEDEQIVQLAGGLFTLRLHDDHARRRAAGSMARA